MKFVNTALPGLILVKPKLFEDDRGFFFESYQRRAFADSGIQAEFVQDNHSRSGRGVLRGLHYQIQHPQGKLVRAIVGEIFDVAVDMRRPSPSFGQWYGVQLSADNKNQLWIPPGYAHGFYVMSEWAEVLYKATDYYAPQWERTLMWNDLTIGIQWPLTNGNSPTLSQKDADGAPLDKAELFD